ncbi:hypothetical protein RFI_14636 [Reticulomyxa filosa]|uniref:Uncharacterized protein n=1 Tax=Reticulomyxa filosa TaxID=46433 RepID=X6N8E7_RETFI|nr:hypothetical protein RFI_14636 [Reticulomyxa filosa]|eukprot:ETO22555.1 hypothetical protein RFI_14636 [Reticulomyxa filosa]
MAGWEHQIVDSQTGEIIFPYLEEWKGSMLIGDIVKDIIQELSNVPPIPPKKFKNTLDEMKELHTQLEMKNNEIKELKLTVSKLNVCAFVFFFSLALEKYSVYVVEIYESIQKMWFTQIFQDKRQNLTEFREIQQALVRFDCLNTITKL